MKSKTFFFLLLIISLFNLRSAFADSSDRIDATVKISVCGNDTKEGGEDCDNTDLNGKSCLILGYTSGTLSCDISCSFDKSFCILLSPTPTPTPTATAASSSTSQVSTPQPTNPPPTSIIVPPTSVPTLALQTFSLIRLPSQQPKNVLVNPTLAPVVVLLGNSDIKNNAEAVKVITTWVNDWKKEMLNAQKATTTKTQAKGAKLKCDYNGDGVCDLKDFSILLTRIKKK